jgi:hypothetical protein
LLSSLHIDRCSIDVLLFCTMPFNCAECDLCVRHFHLLLVLVQSAMQAFAIEKSKLQSRFRMRVRKTIWNALDRSSLGYATVDECSGFLSRLSARKVINE